MKNLSLALVLLFAANAHAQNNAAVSQATAEKAPSITDRLSGSLFLEHAGMGDKFTDADQTSGYSFGQLKYKIDGNNGLRLRQYLTHSYDALSDKTAAHIGDTVVQYDRKSLGAIGSAKLSGSYRLYFPTGESHRKTGETQHRGYLNAKAPINEVFDFKFQSSPRLYTYNNNDSKRQVKWLNKAGVGFKINKVFSGSTHAVTYYESFYDTPNFNKSKVGFDLFIAAKINDTFTTELFVENVVSGWDKKLNLGVPSETFYSLGLSASL